MKQQALKVLFPWKLTLLSYYFSHVIQLITNSINIFLFISPDIFLSINSSFKFDEEDIFKSRWSDIVKCDKLERFVLLFYKIQWITFFDVVEFEIAQKCFVWSINISRLFHILSNECDWLKELCKTKIQNISS